MSLPFHVYDVFTDQPYAGNPLAIVEDADGLTTAQMQTIAREFNLSETIFVQRPKNTSHTARVRIFFPTSEIPFAGHPTIGCAIHLAPGRHGPGDFEATITLEEEAGLVPVSVTRKAGAVRAELIAPVIPEPHPGILDANALAPALDLDAVDIGFADHAPALWAGGPAFLYVPLADRAALSRARPIEPHWSELMNAGMVDSAYLYVSRGENSYSARMFSPTAGIPEDPATGSASAILAAQLLDCRAISDGNTKISITQGEDMGRPSKIDLAVAVSDGKISEIRVAGTACRISSGLLETLPAV